MRGQSTGYWAPLHVPKHAMLLLVGPPPPPPQKKKGTKQSDSFARESSHDGLKPPHVVVTRAMPLLPGLKGDGHSEDRWPAEFWGPKACTFLNPEA